MFEYMRRNSVLRDGMAGTDARVPGGGIAEIVSATTLGKGGAVVVFVDHDESLGGNHCPHSVGPYTYDIGTLLLGEMDLCGASGGSIVSRWQLAPHVLQPKHFIHSE